ncbi:MAG TPA: hypothetical protein V6C76_08435 [Drouetiella sp.]
MSTGSNKSLEATAAKPEQHVAPTAQPNWNVSHQEQLAQIRQERAPQQVHSIPVVVPNVAQQQRRGEVQHAPTVAQQQPRPELHNLGGAGTQTRPDSHVGQPVTATRPDTHTYTPGRTNPEVANNNRGTNTEINRTVVNNRYENQTTNNNRYLYGGLAGGALLGAGAASLYQNRDYGLNYNGSYGNTYQFSNPNYNSWNNGNFALNNFNNFNNYSNYGDYANYGNAGYDQFGNPINGGYDQFGNQLALADNSQYGSYDGTYPSNLYGDTTYGGTPFDSGFMPPPPPPDFLGGPGFIERRPNPLNVIPQLFGSIIGGVLGNITSSNHRRYYGGFPDC